MGPSASSPPAIPERLDTLFLDAGGVLIGPNWDRVSSALAEQGVEVEGEVLRSAEPAAKRLLDQPAKIARSDDDSRGVDLFHAVLERAGVAPSAATERALATVRAYHDESNLWETVLPDVPTSLARLRALDLRLVVVSNANGTVDPLFRRLDLARHFDVLIDSWMEGVEKPDPALFRIALERAGADPDRTLHVGDLYEVDVVGARSAGIRAALIDVDDLYRGCDCPRFRSLAELVEHLVHRDGR